MKQTRNPVFQTIIALTLILATSATIQNSKLCSKLHVGSGISSSKYSDIVNRGRPNEKWTDGSAYPTVIGSSKKLEYFYLADVGMKIEQSDLNLFYNKASDVLSFLTLKRESPGFYTIEVSYNCEVYGGSLIDYRLEINANGCGSAMIAWKKLCGNPYTEREGLSIDMSYTGFHEQIVKNGKIINPNAFDMDVLDAAFNVPANIDKVKFYINMVYSDISSENTTTAHSFNHVESSAANKFDTRTYIEKFKVDSDQFIVQSSLKGDLAQHGKFISNMTSEFVELDLVCQGWLGQSTIEVNVQMPQFKDINLFFVKMCHGANPNSRHIHSFLFYVILIAIVFLIAKCVVNGMDQGFRWQAIPYHDKIEDAVKNIKIPSFKGYSFSGKPAQGLSQQQAQRVVNAEGEEEMRTMNKNDPGFEDTQAEIVVNDEKDYGTF